MKRQIKTGDDENRPFTVAFLAPLSVYLKVSPPAWGMADCLFGALLLSRASSGSGPFA